VPFEVLADELWLRDDVVVEEEEQLAGGGPDGGVPGGACAAPRRPQNPSRIADLADEGLCPPGIGMGGIADDDQLEVPCPLGGETLEHPPELGLAADRPGDDCEGGHRPR